jgi:TonB-dependent starch-binding outer membrane protein SusC
MQTLSKSFKLNPNQMFMKKLYRSLSFTLAALLMFGSAVLAQQRVVTGTVTDETGSPMPGVNVLVKGTSIGTATDTGGKYSISVGDDGVLVFTFVGYTSQENAVGSKTSVDVALVPDVQSLSEIVVTGYQVQRKADISGAVAVVNAADLQNLVASSFAQKLAGRAPGVTVSTSGRPGDVTNVRIRGISSFGNNDPLYVIDGVQLTDKGNLNLNPNDIESMQVLKDPSTAAIYGAAGGNGVIVITTKKGKAGKTKVTYSGSISAAKPVKGWDDILITDSNEYLDMTKKYFGDQALPNYAVGSTLPEYIYVNPLLNGGNSVGDNVDESLYDRYTNPVMRTSPGTNWWDEITRTGIIHDHNVSISGGNDVANFNVAAGALLQEGTIVFNEFNRYNIRANSNFKVGKKVRLGQTLNVAMRNIVNNVAQSEQGTLSQVYKIAPIIPVYDQGSSVDGDGLRDSFGGSKTANTGNAANPYAQLFRNRDNLGKNTNFMGNIYGELDVIEGLTFRTDFKFDVGSNNSRQFSYRTPEQQENQGAQNFREDWGKNERWIWTNTLAYTKTLAEQHKIYALAGYEAQEGTFRIINGSLNNYFTTNINAWYLNPAFGASDTRQTGSNGGADSKLSLFGKVDYSFADKYYFSATVRRDGSSQFSSENQYAVFPALSFAWRVTGESFLANNSFMSDLKIRASWGRVGNDRIQQYNPYDRWGGSVGSAFYAIDGSNSAPATGYHLTNVGTNSLNLPTKWETSETINFGFDATLLDDKFNVVLDIYQRKTYDLLYNAALPGTFGYLAPNAPFRNIAEMTNTGFDLGLGYKGQITSDLKFTADLNFSRYKNVIDKTDGVTDFFYPNSAQGRIDNRLPQQININKVGYSISSFNGYQVEGLFQTQEEVDNHQQAGAQVGGLKFHDLNGDGRISDSDLTVIGNPHPDFTYGLNLGLTYKNFDFNMFFVGSQGNDIFNYVKIFTHFRQFFSNVDREYYQQAGTGDAPAMNILDTSSRSSSEYYVEDGSYFRLGQLQLGYRVPLSGGVKNTLSSLKVYVQGQNLFTVTNYSGLDPALSNANIGDFSNNVQGNFLNDIWTGFDIGQYPSNRMFTLGVVAEF